MKLPRVYPVVDSAAWVRRLLAVGVRLVQLRIKERPEAQGFIDWVLEEARQTAG